MNMMSHIAKLIRFIRIQRMMTQESLAERVGIDYRHFQKIESGAISVKLETLEKILEGLGLSLSNFFQIYDRINFKWLENLDASCNQSSEVLLGIILAAPTRCLSFEVYKSIYDLNCMIQSWDHDSLHENRVPVLELDASGKVVWNNQSLNWDINSNSLEPCLANIIRKVSTHPILEKQNSLVVRYCSHSAKLHWGHKRGSNQMLAVLDCPISV